MNALVTTRANRTTAQITIKASAKRTSKPLMKQTAPGPSPARAALGLVGNSSGQNANGRIFVTIFSERIRLLASYSVLTVTQALTPLRTKEKL
jgi:hypothetical protein